VSVIAAENEDDAVEIANASIYGLSGAVFSADPLHALAVAQRIETGTVEINGASAGRYAPQGGWKSSGIGREVGPEGIDAYVEITAFGVPVDIDESVLGDPPRV
jgi:aldehyde dehydrogenase (NAD+)